MTDAHIVVPLVIKEQQNLLLVQEINFLVFFVISVEILIVGKVHAD
jgi:hypothetical protein